MAPSVFVNFCRADTGTLASHIETALRAEFGKEEVFRDRSDIEGGSYFPDQIAKNLRKCDILLAIMGAGWVSVTDEHGRRRLDDPKYWVRWEIERALEWGLVVLPVMVDGVDMPDKKQLPVELHKLTMRQNIPFRPEHPGIDFPPLFEEIRTAVPALGSRRRGGTATGNGVSLSGGRFDHAAVVVGGEGNTANNYNFTPGREDGDEDEVRP
ncbi:TIR domain-containing protein [Streptomyces sp. NPDC005728]|uniref:TIR domain-containing protein n=1 Tax=Streptomyces sp. NPDC005728 TaxID=3157054 RepID=UPI0033C50A94